MNVEFRLEVINLIEEGVERALAEKELAWLTEMQGEFLTECEAFAERHGMTEVDLAQFRLVARAAALKDQAALWREFDLLRERVEEQGGIGGEASGVLGKALRLVTEA